MADGETKLQLGLLSVPREIRDQIYHELVVFSSEPPISPDEAGLRDESIFVKTDGRNKRFLL